MVPELNSTFPQLAADLHLVRAEMKAVAAHADHRVCEPLEHFLACPGRLFRPSLTLMAAYLTAGPVSARAPTDVVKAAAVVEFLHVATLYHDDIVDEADTRRGVPTLNSRFGNETAVLSGDYLLACCIQLLSQLGGQATETIARTVRAMCAGQITETADRFDAGRTEDAYFAAIGGKTAELLGASARLGAMVAGASATACQAISAYARHLGLAFQIWDDIRDIRTPSTVTGKAAGKDVENGVYTLPVIYGMEAVPGELSPLLAEPEFGPSTEHRVRELLERSGAFNRAVLVAEQHVRQAFSATAGLRSGWSTSDAEQRFAVIARVLIPELDRFRLGGPTPDATASCLTGVS